MSDFDKTNLPDGSGEEDLTADLMAVASHSRGSKKSRNAGWWNSWTCQRPAAPRL